eukprot:1196393-Prorocentrum_minimum.AAC.3
MRYIFVTGLYTVVRHVLHICDGPVHTRTRLQLEAKQGIDTEAKQRKSMMVTRKQDKLLYVCLYLLLNLAEDVNIERKMKKRNVVVYLAKASTKTPPP